jgi:hypothetical protein
MPGTCKPSNLQFRLLQIPETFDEFHDQVDTKWIVIRGLRGHKDKPCRWPTPGRLIGRPQGVFVFFKYLQSIYVKY